MRRAARADRDGIRNVFRKALRLDGRCVSTAAALPAVGTVVAVAAATAAADSENVYVRIF